MGGYIEYIKKRYYFIFSKYFAFFAKYKINRKKTEVILVTGSWGKSTLVAMLDSILKCSESSRSFKILEHANSSLGIPLALLGLNSDKKGILFWIKSLLLAPIKSIFGKGINTDILIVEADSDRNGELNITNNLLKPDVVFISGFGLTHTLNFEDKNRNGVANNSSIDDGKNKRNHSISNLMNMKIINEFLTPIRNNENLKHGYINSNYKIKNELNNVYTFRFSDKLNDIKFLDHKITSRGTDYTFSFKGKEVVVTLPKQILQIEFFTSIALLYKFAIDRGIKNKKFIIALKKAEFPSGRSSIFRGINSSVIIDSTYNSSYEPLISMLKLIDSFDRPKILILGDMRELGIMEESEHRKIARYISNHNYSSIFLTGEAMQKYVFPYLTDKKNLTNVRFFSSTKDMHNYLIQTKFSDIQKNSICLVKGSQNTIFLEVIVEDLLYNKLDTVKLCRQSSEFKNIKRKLLE